MQAKWEEMFGEKKEEVVEDVKVKKPRKKAVVKKTAPKKQNANMKKTSTKKKSNTEEVAVQKTLKKR